MDRVAMTEQETAHYLGISTPLLQKSRVSVPIEGRFPPPPYVRLGEAVRYLRPDLDRWLVQFRVNQANLEPGW